MTEREMRLLADLMESDNRRCALMLDEAQRLTQEVDRIISVQIARIAAYGDELPESLRRSVADAIRRRQQDEDDTEKQ